jgi:Leucine-rich repeat (LRR) protein
MGNVTNVDAGCPPGSFMSRGPLPESLANLVALESLNISGNLITGKLPFSWTALTALTSLDASHNQFSGTVPGKKQLTTR